MASEIPNYQRKLYCQHIQTIIFRWLNIWEPFTEPHKPHQYHLWNSAHEGADAHYVLKSQYHCCPTATWCLTMSHADLSGKKDDSEVLNNTEMLTR